MWRRLGVLLAVPLTLALVACGGASATPAPPTTAPAPAATTAAPSAAPATAARQAATTAAAATTRTPAALPTVTALATTAPATPATATRAGATPRAATPGGAGGVGTEPTGTCQVGIPAGFTAVGGQAGAWTDRAALLILTPVPTIGQDFAAWTQTVARLLTSGGPPGVTLGAVEQQPGRYRAAFTSPADPANPVIPYAAQGTFVAVPATADQVCAAELIYPQGQEGTYAPLVAGIVASLAPAR